MKNITDQHESNHGYGQCRHMNKPLLKSMFLLNQIGVTNGEDNLDKQSIIIGVIKVLTIFAILFLIVLLLIMILKKFCPNKNEDVEKNIQAKVQAKVKEALNNIQPENLKKSQTNGTTNIKYTKLAGGVTTIIIEDEKNKHGLKKDHDKMKYNRMQL